MKGMAGAGFILLGVILLLALFVYTRQLRICGIFLKYAGKFISSSPRILFVIPVFVLLNAGLLCVFLFELLAVWGSGLMVFDEQTPYYRSVSGFSWAMTAVNFVGLYWGFAFLNEASTK